ncbi:MAG TPA: aldo/keto reductase [Gemmatimonadaceae bacterium]|jgi:L-glyceraldehyde 3-phosphate reductase|nr:aldo/keto reductase [Gemmatimonadaceae bacterium]
MIYRRVGRSGLQLPVVSLGLWHNFGSVDSFETARAMVRRAFELGITHFDLANNYGPEPGSAEETFGRILARDLAGHRDEMVISTKAGYPMWAGPYGDGGSRKYLVASLDQSLRRMGLEYVDIFYHHRPDPGTPIEETMAALDHVVRSGKALYVGLSSYDPAETRAALDVLRALGTPCLIHQPKYSMFERRIEDGLLATLAGVQVGCIVFSPLAQGLLTDRYLREIPSDSRAAKTHGALRAEAITEEVRARIVKLHEIAAARGQSLAQLALAWVLRHRIVCSALIGASRPAQIDDGVGALERLALSDYELGAIDRALASGA